MRTAVSLLLCCCLAACAGQPSQNTSAKPGSAVDALYMRMDADSQRYLGASGGGKAADATAALDDLRAAANACVITRGCDSSRFVVAFDKLLREHPATEAPPSGDAEAAPAEAAPEAGESSPVVAALPEAQRSVALLKGRKLADIIAMNDPVKLAIEQWLTQYRPNLMKAYENYQYLRSRMWPEYEKAGLPEALLFGMMAQESGGKVHAVSHSGASGPLQFMSATGARFGLGVVDGFDQRFDPALSARANAAYMNERLAELNDNLELAIGAYNGGEGAMQRLSAHAPQESFWSPKIYFALSQETRDYVPMVLGAAWLFLHPERYNLVFPKLETKSARVTLQKPASLDELTICLGQSGNADGWFRTLRNLNPALDPRQKLDAGTAIEAPALLAAEYAKSCAAGKWVELASDLHSAAQPVVPPSAPAPARDKRPRVYVVRKGDTLDAIARKHGCSGAGELARLNHLKAPDYLVRVGQELRVCTRG
jgi:membrane-bound lytic murein transglycosylase D